MAVRIITATMILASASALYCFIPSSIYVIIGKSVVAMLSTLLIAYADFCIMTRQKPSDRRSDSNAVL